MDQQRQQTPEEVQDTFGRIRAAIHQTVPDSREHPDHLTLASYAKGSLSKEQEEQVDRHLMLCTHNRCHRFLAACMRTRHRDFSFARFGQDWLRWFIIAPWRAMPAFGAAVALVLFFWARGPLTHAPLPGYSAELHGHQQTWLAADERAGQDPPIYSWDSIMEVTLRPQLQVHGPVEVRMFLAQASIITDIYVSDVLEVGTSGAIHLQQKTGNLLSYRVGQFYLLIGVGRPGTLPAKAVIQHLGFSGVRDQEELTQGGWQWFRWLVDVRSETRNPQPAPF